MKIALIVTVVLLTACSSFLAEQERAYYDYQMSIKKYISEYPNYTDENIERLKSSNVRTGMTLQEVMILADVDPLGDSEFEGKFICDGVRKKCVNGCESCKGSLHVKVQGMKQLLSLRGTGDNPVVHKITVFAELPSDKEKSPNN